MSSEFMLKAKEEGATLTSAAQQTETLALLEQGTATYDGQACPWGERGG